MNVLAIMGSARKKSNTDKFLNIFIDKFNLRDENIDIYNLKDLNYRGCISCYGCAKKPECVVKDDISEIYSKIENADLIIFATPIYFNSVSWLAKSFIDRMQVYWSRKFLLKLPPIKEKRAIALIDGGAYEQENQFLGSELVFDHFFKATSCKNNILIEVTNTDDVPIDESNKELMELLNMVNFENIGNKTYRLSGGKIDYEIK